MPAQIYTWAARADASFYEKAWGGIIILLIFLLAMNVIAIILRIELLACATHIPAVTVRAVAFIQHLSTGH